MLRSPEMISSTSAQCFVFPTRIASLQRQNDNLRTKIVRKKNKIQITSRLIRQLNFRTNHSSTSSFRVDVDRKCLPFYIILSEIGTDRREPPCICDEYKSIISIWMKLSLLQLIASLTECIRNWPKHDTSPSDRNLLCIAGPAAESPCSSPLFSNIHNCIRPARKNHEMLRIEICPMKMPTKGPEF